MVYAYYRYSTNKQTEMQQEFRVNEYCDAKGLRIDEVFRDRAVSGTVQIENRNLADLIAKIEPGDVIIVSEVSRISRSLADFCQFVLVTMPRLKARLIICNMGLDIDCAERMNPMLQVQLMMFSCVAQMEREFVSDRTKAALDARKALAKKGQGWTSKSGNYCKKLGSPQNLINSAAWEKSAMNKKKKFMTGMRPIVALIRQWREDGFQDFEIAEKLNEMGVRTGFNGKFQHSHIKKMIKYDEEGIEY